MLYWNYFLTIESDLNHLSRFIEFNEKNFDTYSIEIVRLLLAISSEVDVVLKALCGTIVASKKESKLTINDYRTIITTKYKDFCNEKVFINRYNLEFSPWLEWTKNKNPDWWKSYNDVKHRRNKNYHKANLFNLLNAFSGLLVSIYYFKKAEITIEDSVYNNDPINELKPVSNLFRLANHRYIFADRSVF